MRNILLIIFLIGGLLCGPNVIWAGDAATFMGKAPSAISTIAGKSIDAIATFSGASVPSGAPACTTSNDSKVVDNGNVGNADYDPVAPWRARQFTIAAQISVTGCWTEGYDSGAGATITCAIWGDTSGAPNPADVEIAENKSTSTQVPDSNAQYEIPFDATYTLAAGTYWVIFHDSGSASLRFREDNTVNRGDTSYSSDGSSWSATNGDTVHGVMGCD